MKALKILFLFIVSVILIWSLYSINSEGVTVFGKTNQNNNTTINNSNNTTTNNTTTNNSNNDTGSKNDVKRISSYEELEKLVKENLGNTSYGHVESGVGIAFSESVAVADSAVNGSASSKAASDRGMAGGSSNQSMQDYSATNVQVEGVDEADIVKTDGEYIYQVNKNRIITIKAYPAENMEVISDVDYSDNDFRASEIYIEGDMLIVIGSSKLERPLTEEEKISGNENKKQISNASAIMDIALPGYGFYGGNATKALIYDIKDRKNPVLIRDAAVDGSYISSRKIGTALYIITNKNTYEYINNKPKPVIPLYRDTPSGGETVQLDYKDIYYFPDTNATNYMLVSAISLDNMEDSIKISAYLGAGSNIYASPENLYVAVTTYRTVDKQDKDSSSDNTVSMDEPVSSKTGAVNNNPVNTLIYKFKLNDTKVEYVAKGEVPGTILNQFSMDEYMNYFRIATTKGNMWSSGEDISKNNIYVLNENMELTGKIEDIAPGERIYSTRFMGERAYMVTFRNVDPLFVIDLSDPANPKILGALKIPGYSDYLHPYDENHIIGFGKDTVEVSSSDMNGLGETMAFYQGIKMALFDVSDVNNPIQKYSVIIGDRGTDSELLYNHKALLFSKEKNLIAFPVTLYEIKNKNVEGNKLYNATQYGEFTFQGAYIYSLDLENGFTLKGRISHMNEEDYLKAGRYYYQNDKSVKRIMYIGNNLYTLSEGMIKANLIDTLEQVGQVAIP